MIAFWTRLSMHKGKITMLDKNEYKDLSDWYTEEIGK